MDTRYPPYIVASVERGPSERPRVHDTKDSAMREARRLAIQHPDDAFDVYRAVARIEAPKVVVTEFEVMDEDIPF